MVNKRFVFRDFVGYSYAIYFLITGLWPLIDINSFMEITGPKTDIWLVKTVGALVLPTGLLVLRASIIKKYNIEIILMALGAAIALLSIDLYYVFKDVISKVYLLDAFAETIFIICWIYLLKTKQAGPR